MKTVLCKKLASCLRMTTTNSKPVTMPASDNDSENQPLKGSDRLPMSDSDREEQAGKGYFNNTELLLARLVELQELRLRHDAEERERADANEEAKGDWLLAASVIDRIFFIAVNFIFFGGTVVFFVSFALSP